MTSLHPLDPTDHDKAERIGAVAQAALLAELVTWPKPGLVSRVDNGSHRDMDAGTLDRSAAALRPFFAALARAGRGGADMEELRRIGRAAETAMMRATGGINAHRGAIFSLGLLCAAEGARGFLPGSAEDRCLTVAALWGPSIVRMSTSGNSNGSVAARRFGVGGARAEAANGFPTLRAVGIPALREGCRARPDNVDAARVHCFFALLATLDDTNLLHRGGAAGLAFAKSCGRTFLAAGGVADPDWLNRAALVHRRFVARNLSPGGSADLLAASLFLAGLDDRERPAAIDLAPVNRVGDHREEVGIS